ncbi:MAG TPA: hypothetical protein ENN67_06625 [Firmicutes bacterium]|nr:hypothetical protein [Bacillota bacterium]
MGIRGIDIQVAIQRAAEAEKIQQGESSQAKAGEAGTREHHETERARKLEQPPQTERGDQVLIHGRKERKDRDEDSEDKPEKEIEEELSGDEESEEDFRKKPKPRGNLDIFA